MTYMLVLKCALKLVEEIILYYDGRSKKHQTINLCSFLNGITNDKHLLTNPSSCFVTICSTMHRPI